jgi:hypothetical protein
VLCSAGRCLRVEYCVRAELRIQSLYSGYSMVITTIIFLMTAIPPISLSMKDLLSAVMMRA